MCGFLFCCHARLHRAMVLRMSQRSPIEQSIKIVAYLLGGFIASVIIAATVMIPQVARFRAKGPANSGHDALVCSNCHKDAPGTMRQQLQAKVQFWLGMRATDAVFGHTPSVTSNAPLVTPAIRIPTRCIDSLSRDFPRRALSSA